MKLSVIIHRFRKLYIPITESMVYRFFIFRAYMSDERYLKWKFKKRMGYRLNLETPQTFNEKLQWLKLHDRQQEYTQMVDKYAVRGYIKETIGEKYLVPLYGKWDRPEDIDFNALPDQFVLKTNHDSGGVLICKDKNNFDKAQAIKFLKKRMRFNSYWPSREWPYKNIKKCVIAEKYLEDSKYKELRDYKFFTFNGVVKALFIATERNSVNSETKFDFFDADYEKIEVINGHPNSINTPTKPECFDEMKLLATKLARKTPHLRVDFYEVDGRVYFGELTFYHWGGFVPFKPEKWDIEFGNWIKLPTSSGKNNYKIEDMPR